eukprot:2995323-Rhodomonas_salina.1
MCHVSFCSSIYLASASRCDSTTDGPSWGSGGEVLDHVTFGYAPFPWHITQPHITKIEQKMRWGGGPREGLP